MRSDLVAQEARNNTPYARRVKRTMNQIVGAVVILGLLIIAVAVWIDKRNTDRFQEQMRIERCARLEELAREDIVAYTDYHDEYQRDCS